ncbi:hypothetical protein H257_09074 [Aphanomyces astaci]|uniref:Cyclin N-terminal domain-containing protein n=1 Tax=Aphanomyces astaci TaxID=112090 RepID=W4GBX8_APHAT|nr:hypothetical protein H257_09074 [Aphanomyces astaci]ETV77187.1 hypothetical protein H257_09074 [Aphanomyces astaci]|eukprot:XP_009833493.1 hypothetical protein H257_09074 [Aphanomyces astaci]
MADAPPRSDEPSVNDAGPISPVASQQTTTPISPLNLSSHRQLHDTYKVITPVNSPKRAPQPTSEVGSPQNAAAAATQKRPNLHLNLSVIKSAPSRPLVPSATGRVKKVTRDIAALDFLQNIPMSSEYYSSATDTNYLNSPVPHDANDAVLSDNEDEHALAGRRLPGPDCQVVRMPPLIRYRMTTKYPPASATVRLWEGNMNEVGLVNSRIFLSSGKGYPVAVTSVIKYNGNQTKVRHPFRENNVVAPYDWRGKSYFQLLHATWSACDKDRDAQDKHPVVPPYEPNFLDNPEYRQGRHKDVIRGDRKLGPMVSSILRFVKPNDLKEELNKQFRETHTWLHDTDLSLSKIRNLKQEALLMGQRIHLDISTVALACVYFEKLVLENYVTKPNRKLYMSACLILAVKFNEPRGTDDLLIVVKKLLAEVDRVHSIPSREVLAVEFKVYTELSFALHVRLADLQPHFTRLLKCMESNPRKYLGEDIFEFYSKLVHDEATILLPLNEQEDDETDGENVLSDTEELEQDGRTESGRQSSLFPWNQVSFAQWWKDRT